MRIAFFLAAAASLNAQRVIRVDNAAGAGFSEPAGAVAPGSLVRVRIVRGGPVIINTTATRVSVRVRPVDSDRALETTFIPGPIFTPWVLLPRELAPGPAEVTLLVDGEASDPARVNVITAAPGLYTRDQSGTGTALTAVKLTESASPGQTITLWGTGLGNADATGARVEFGGLAGVVAFAGPAPGFPGLDQFNVAIPADAPLGCTVSVRLRAGEAASNLVTLPIAAGGGPCEHPYGLGREDLADLDAGRQVPTGEILLTSRISPGREGGGFSRVESATVEFRMRSGFDLLGAAQVVDDAILGCRIENPLQAALFFSAGDDAGNRLSLAGPAESLDLPRTQSGQYRLDRADAASSITELPASLFPPGPWRVIAPGGDSIPAFAEGFSVAPAMVWSNRDSLSTIAKSEDVNLTWDNTGYMDADLVLARLMLSPVEPGISCLAPAAQSELQIPAGLIARLRAGSATLELGVQRRPSRRERFTVRRSNGRAMATTIGYSFTEAVPVTIQ